MTPSDASRKPHWAVQMNHLNRSISWIAAFIVIGIHFHEKGYGPAYWICLALHFLIYPHVVYWRARRAEHQLQAEIQNLLCDNVLFGMWAMALGFPLWICHTLISAGALNLSVYRGARGVLQALLAVLGGAGIVYGLGGAGPLALDTSPLVSTLCMTAMLFYLLLFARSMYGRTVLLSETRVKLRRSEQALQRQLEAVQALQLQLTDQANHDALTGLYNRRYLDDTLPRELDRCARSGSPISVLLIDLDHFKTINDTHGHAVGDEVLKRAAAILQQQLRASDICCRYGGEEFLMVLPGMDLDAALTRAEHCRQLMAHHDWDQELPSVTRVTLSVGVACAMDGDITQDALIHRADMALYQAKSGGRNRVVLDTSGAD